MKLSNSQDGKNICIERYKEVLRKFEIHLLTFGRCILSHESSSKSLEEILSWGKKSAGK